MAVALTLSACSSSDESSSTSLAEVPPSVPAPQIDRAGVDSAIDQLDGYVEKIMTDTGAPGVAVAVVYEGEVLYARGFGVKKVGEPGKVDTSTMFQLASVSKPLASSVVATVVGDGKIKWDDPVKTFEPGFAVSDPYVTANATYTDLMSHRSGLPDHAGDLLEDLGYSYPETISRLNQVPLYRFRDHYDYTNYGFSIAGNAAANATGMSWADLSEQAIYEPLGMENTTSRYDEWLNSPNRAFNHQLTDADAKTWAAEYVSNPAEQAPAGGAMSSVDDMAKWVQMELADGMFDGQQVVDAEELQFTHQAHSFSHPSTTPGARDSFYGIGFNVDTDAHGRVQIGHAGAFALGASTDVKMLPSEQLGIVVLANTAPVGVAETLTAEFLDYVSNGKLTVDWAPFIAGQFEMVINAGRSEVDYANPPADAPPARPTSDYIGKYTSPFYGPAEVVAEGNNLVIKIGRDLQQSYPLTHYQGDTFWFAPIGENSAGPTGAEFTGAGPASSLTIEYLDKDGLGIFTRAPQ
ncbi:serine hydrolase [Williamsia soli]|uniref:serine hydrolase n=1 Tax=Williamsia soli TaxID=364929 RepID=UPI001F3993EE|nr:serine hydrolase [Williamsia soli]